MPPERHILRLAFLGALQEYRDSSWKHAVSAQTKNVLPARAYRAALRLLRDHIDAHPYPARFDLRMVGYSWGAWTAIQLARMILRRPDRIHPRLRDLDLSLTLGLLDPVSTLRRRATLPADSRLQAYNVFQRNGCYKGCPGPSAWYRGQAIEGAIENRDVSAEGRDCPPRNDVPSAHAPDHLQIGYLGWNGHDVYIASYLETGARPTS